jgi:prepilin-type processing-associated H-X9-DG protein
MRRWVNVVVVLAVLVCVGLLVVLGVARVREAAAGMSCQNNLKQLGMALHNYHDANGSLPPLVDQGDRAATGTGLVSAHSTLIPYLESTPWFFRPKESLPAVYHAHSSVQSAIHGNKDGTRSTAYGGIVNQVLWRAFLDPSDQTADKLRDVPMTLPDGSTGYYATGSYAANGLLPWGGKIPGGQLGGLANTIMFGERPQVCRTAAGDDVHNLWGVGFYSPQMPAFAALAPATLDGFTTGQVAPVWPPSDGRVRIGRADASPQPPDFATPIQRIVPGRPCDPRLPGTPHRGGMQAGMADGSVRVFTLDTDPQVFWAACGGLP